MVKLSTLYEKVWKTLKFSMILHSSEKLVISMGKSALRALKGALRGDQDPQINTNTSAPIRGVRAFSDVP